MKKISLSLFMIAALSAHASNAIIHQITRWWHPGLQQEVNILKDAHLDTQDCHATFAQHVDIAQREHHAFRIIEDLTDEAIHPHLKELIREHFSSLQQDSFNIKLVTLNDYYALHSKRAEQSYEDSICMSPMKRLHVLKNTYNAEFRAIGLYLYSGDLGRMQSETLTIIDDISSYNDGPVLNAYYQDTIKASCLKFGSDAFDKLLDARVLHTLHNNPDKPVVDIVVGFWHGDNIEPILEKLGYVKKVSVGPISKEMSQKAPNIMIPVIDIKRALAQPLALTQAKPIQAKL